MSIKSKGDCYGSRFTLSYKTQRRICWYRRPYCYSSKERYRNYCHNRPRLSCRYSYGIGSRNLSRYNTDLAAIRAAIKELEDDIAALEALLNGQRPRKAVGVVPRDW